MTYPQANPTARVAAFHSGTVLSYLAPLGTATAATAAAVLLFPLRIVTFPFSFSHILLTLSPHPSFDSRRVYGRSAYIRLCGKLLRGRACGTCTARGEAAAAVTAATSGQSLVSRPSEQQAPREARRASERSPLCARGQWARVGACSTECECGPRACFTFPLQNRRSSLLTPPLSRHNRVLSRLFR